MTTTDRRDGPVLRVVGSCEGCRWLRADESISAFRQIASYVYHCGEPSQIKVHPLGARYRKIGRRPATPAWCPEMGPAQRALARSIVAEAERAEEAEEAAARKRSDDACEPDPFAVDAAFNADCETCSGHRFISDPDRPSGYRKCLNCNGSGKQ